MVNHLWLRQHERSSIAGMKFLIDRCAFQGTEAPCAAPEVQADGATKVLFPHIDVWGFCFYCGIRSSSFLLLLLPPPPGGSSRPTATNKLSPTNSHQPIVINQLLPTNCHPPIATNQLSPTNCHQPIATNQLSPTNCHQPTATNELPTTNCPLLCLVKLLTCGVIRSYNGWGMRSVGQPPRHSEQ